MLGIRRWRSDRTPPRSGNTLKCSYECVRKHLKVALGNLLSSPPTMQTRCPRPPLVYSKATCAASGGRQRRESLARRASAAPRLGGGGWVVVVGRQRRPQVDVGGRPQVAAARCRAVRGPSRGAVDPVAGGAAARSGRRNRRLVDVAVGARRARLSRRSNAQDIRENDMWDRATIRGSEKPPTAREISRHKLARRRRRRQLQMRPPRPMRPTHYALHSTLVVARGMAHQAHILSLRRRVCHRRPRMPNLRSGRK